MDVQAARGSGTPPLNPTPEARGGPDPDVDPGPGPGARATLLAVGLGTLVTLMAFTAPATTLAATAGGLHAGPVAQTWMFTGTPVGLAALLLTMGSTADARGRRRVFRAGAVLLVLASVLSAAAPDTALFLTGRILQGAASAAVLAAGLGLIAHTHPAGPHRVRALGWFGAVLGAGIALGPCYAAALTQLWGWRSLYWGLAALAAVAAVLTAAVPESRAGRARSPDLTGALVLGAGIACLVAAFGEGRSGWTRAAVVVPLVAGLALLVLFGGVERRVREPMLDPALWCSPAFLAASAGAFATGLAVVGLFSYLPTELEVVLGMTPLAASLLFIVWAGVSAVTALFARHLAGRIGAATQVAAGLLLSGGGQAGLYGIRAGGSWGHLVPGLAVAGVGGGVLNAALARLAVSSVAADRSAMGSGANNTARYVGSALGLALTVSLASAAHGPTPAVALAAGANHGFVAAAGVCGVGAAVVLLLGRERGARDG